MLGFFKMKSLLLGIFLASPAVAAWMLRHPEPIPGPAEIQLISSTTAAPQSGLTARIPVEILAKGSAPRWVYVEVGSEAVPEPGVISLMGLASLLLVFRRQR